MAIVCELAMTAVEFATAGIAVSHPAWMACHFSPYGTGLSNCPTALPKGAMVILNDRTPAHGHDPQLILHQLQTLTEQLNCGRVLLDYQRPDSPENAAVAQLLTKELSCPVGVSELYAKELDCPVFLPPPLLHCPLEDYLSPWTGREIWLEVALEGETATVNSQGTVFALLPPGEAPEGGHYDETLCCHYLIDVQENQIRFTLFRNKEDLTTLLKNAEKLGVTRAVGLYQELGSHLNDAT